VALLIAACIVMLLGLMLQLLQPSLAGLLAPFRAIGRLFLRLRPAHR
jgi:hypothetical protein